MSSPFTNADLEFFRAVGIDPESGESVEVAHPDGTVRILERLGIPVTRENYLMLAFAGHPPEDPLDGEIEIQIPRELRAVEDDDEGGEG